MRHILTWYRFFLPDTPRALAGPRARKVRAKSIARLAVLLFLVLFTGCVGGSKSKIEENKKRLKEYILNETPKNVGRKLNIEFEDKLTLLGAKIQPRTFVKPGQEVELTMYWKVNKPLDKGWQLFTHILDGSGERIMNIDNVGPLRESKDDQQALPPSAWEAKKVYVDTQKFKVPKDVKTKRIQIAVGVWRDKERLKVVKGRKDKDNRGIVANLRTSRSSRDRPVSTRVPTLRVRKLAKDATITIDGKLDDPAWRRAAYTGSFKDPDTGRRNRDFPIRGSARMLWDERGFYVAFDVKDSDIVGGFDKGAVDAKLWTKDTVEIMIDPDGDGDNKDYYEIQINPQNLVFDSQFDDYNEPKQEPDGPFGHQDWSANLKSAVTVDGTLDKPGDKDKSYIVEAFIPWKSLSKAKQVPPKPGDTWRMNFYAMQNNSGVAWSPILKQGNFHKASRFGKVTWLDVRVGGKDSHVRRLTGGKLGRSPIDIRRPPRLPPKPAPASSK